MNLRQKNHRQDHDGAGRIERSSMAVGGRRHRISMPGMQSLQPRNAKERRCDPASA
jgi:hypothetical protein